jgi:Ca2+-binding RTX toxin-like protein
VNNLSEPSTYEQYMLELVNAARMKSGIQPLANNGHLNDAADTQASWMISTNTLSHTGAGGSSPYDRMVAAGFVFSGGYSWGENYAWETLRGAAGYTDEVKDLHNWLMNSPTHLANIMNASFTQVGIGFAVGPLQGWQSALAVEDFAGTSQHFLTGVTYNDLNGDHAYEPGEGLGGLTVTAIGSAGDQHVMRTYGSGGYDLALAAGTYTVTISGSNISPFTQQVTVGSANVKLDLVNPGQAPVTPPPTGGVTITGTALPDVISPLVTILGQLLPGTGNDTIYGLDGADTLNGGAGADVLVGGTGDDVVVVDNTGDQVVEGSLSGNDLVQASVTYTLPAEVERLTLTGTAAINGTGNTLSNVMTGNAAGNVFSGAAGNDTLLGMDGADTLRGDDGNDKLDGGTGADRMEGGLGNDSYYVDSTGDVVVEAAAGGSDRVFSPFGYTLGANLESLYLTGTAAVDATGNSVANTIGGNSGANHLYGLGGNDILNGGSGNDTLNGGAGADSLSGASGLDTFVFARGEAQGDYVQDFTLGDHLQFTGYSAGSTITQVVGSATDWLVKDLATGVSELIHLTNGYALTASDYVFG